MNELVEVLTVNLNGILSTPLLSLLFNTDNILDFVRNITINNYAMQVDVVLKDREYYYLKTPEQNEKMLVDVQTNLGLEMAIESTAPVLGALDGLEFIKLFLASTFMTIVFFMILLSVMLIYSLMIADVEEKTYEMGMLRALGLRRVSLIQLIVIQSVIFSVIGLLVGLTISATLNVGMRYYIFNYSKNRTTYWLSLGAMLSGLLVGALMPLLSNVWAIKRSLGKKIRDSLDIFHTGVNDIMVRIIKLESFGLSVFEITLGITLTFMGVLTYYFVPAAFLFNRLDLFFFILNLILIGMIIGLAFLSFLIFPFVQAGIIYLITSVIRFDIKLRPLILKNLNSSHKKRNMKTAMLFTIALSYIIFGGSSLLLIGNLIIGFVKNFIGSDILISSFFSPTHLPEVNLREFINNEMAQNSPKIEMFAFRGQEFGQF